MNYKELIQKIKDENIKTILITGAHRSGTTFAGKALAYTLERLYFDEKNIGGGNVEAFNSFKNRHSEYILQAPGLSINCDKVNVDLVIYMKRSLPDIIDAMRLLSQRVIDNQFQALEDRFGTMFNNYSLPLAKLKAFEKYQAEHIKNWVFLDYESLKDHPLWINETDRVNWTIKQTNNEFFKRYVK